MSSGEMIFSFAPIGLMQSCFSMKNGTGRQGAVCPHARGILKIQANSGTDSHLVEGLAEFSHVILIWLFSDNRSTRIPSKVKPPRASGKMGCLATRSPHRPNEIGLSVVRLESVDVENATLHLSGVDLVHGTPVLDVKPYVIAYDGVEPSSQYREASWLRPNGVDNAMAPAVEVNIDQQVVDQVNAFVANGVTRIYRSTDDLLATVREILSADPRSRYRKNLHAGAQDGSPLLDYPFMIDTLNFVSRFSDAVDLAFSASAHVFAVEDWSEQFDRNVQQQHDAAMQSAANSKERALKLCGAIPR